MQLNTKPMKLGLITGIITLILIGFYVLREKDDVQSVSGSSMPVDQQQTMAKDPFKEYLDKQQQGISAQPSQPAQVMDGNSTSTITPPGSDPFKVFLESQSKSKPEEAVISPFAGGK